MERPTLGITIGDPDGIGPEVTLKALLNVEKKNLAHYRVYANQAILSHPMLKKYYTQLTHLDWVWCDNQPSGGHYAYQFIKMATEDALQKKIDALVTAPISKEALQKAGYPYTGHTTLLKSLTKSTSVSMAFYSEPLKIILATIHHPLKNVPNLITPDCLKTATENAFIFAHQLGITHPKIALAGLNPHAGENGLLGTEEIDILMPFVKQWNDQHTNKISGPFSGDTIFWRAKEGEFDIVIALYHDQGLIPLKLLAFETAVNVTIGLPFIRTSPDHGTAFDIAYQDKASEKGMVSAIELAIKINLSFLLT